MVYKDMLAHGKLDDGDPLSYVTALTCVLEVEADELVLLLL